MASVIFHAHNQIKKTGSMKLFRSHNPDFKDGEQMRDFIYVKDLIDVCIFFMHHRKNSGIYNLGSGKARTFKDLVTNTFVAMGITPDISFMDTPADIRDKYQYFTQANMSKLRSVGYTRPFLRLEEGIDDYVKNYLFLRRLLIGSFLTVFKIDFSTARNQLSWFSRLWGFILPELLICRQFSVFLLLALNSIPFLCVTVTTDTQRDNNTNMSKEDELLEEITSSEYKYGFVTDIEADEAPAGLSDDIVRFISAKKNEPEWMLEWRLKAYHMWLDNGRTQMAECSLSAKSIFRKSNIIRLQKRKKRLKVWMTSIRNCATHFERLGISLNEQKRLSGVLSLLTR